MEKKKVLKTLIGMVLAFAITFAAVPQTASAAVAYSPDKINVNAQAGKSYTIKSYFPGIGYQKLKVKFDTVSKEDCVFLYGRSAYPAKRAKVVMNITVPKSTQNKIKNNAIKMAKACKYSYVCENIYPALMDANTGFAFNNSNLSGKIYQAVGSKTNVSTKRFSQTSGFSRGYFEYYTNLSYSYDIVYPSSNEGNILLGIAGTNKEVKGTSTKITSFTSGNAPLTNSAFYKKKMKNLSIWTRL